MQPSTERQSRSCQRTCSSPEGCAANVSRGRCEERVVVGGGARAIGAGRVQREDGGGEMRMVLGRARGGRQKR